LKFLGLKNMLITGFLANSENGLLTFVTLEDPGTIGSFLSWPTDA
jgi:hypothetical protein